MRLVSSFRLCWFLCGITLQNWAIAQSIDSTVTAKTIDQVVITAQYRPTDTKSTVNSVKIIGQSVINSKAAVNLQELLQTESNIRVTHDPILGSQLSINGLKGENLKIMIDGVPIIGRLNGNLDAGQIPLNAIQKIEIIEGAQSLMYGSEASGGVINIITKKSQLHRFNLNGDTYHENNGFTIGSLGLGMRTEKLFVSLIGQMQKFRPDPIDSLGRDQIWNDKDQRSMRGMFKFTPNTKNFVTFTTQVLSETILNPGELRRPQFKPYSFDDTYETLKYDANVQYDKWLNDNMLWQTTTGYNAFRRNKLSKRYDFETEASTLLEGMQDTTKNNTVLIRSTIAKDNQNKFFNWHAGIENYYENAAGTRLLDSTIYKNGNVTVNDFSLFGSIKLVKSVWTIQSGARLTVNSKYGSALSPSIWTLYHINPAIQWRSSIAFGYRSPSIKELYFDFVDINHQVTGNQNLLPERSINARTEFQFDFIKRQKLHWKATISPFFNHVNDRIILTALGPVHYEYRNVEVWKTYGNAFKMQCEIENLGRFSFDFMSTSFHNSFRTYDPTLPSSIWSHDFTIEATVFLKKDKFHWNTWMKKTGETPYYISENNIISEKISPAWAMWNTTFSLFLKNKRVTLQGGIKNILNVRQLVANTGNGIHVEQANQQTLHWGRTGFVQIKFNIDG
ncbi:MAG: TonB-dependent receptor [Saprospiraceae bacterium]